jgi:hypothetical protein
MKQFFSILILSLFSFQGIAQRTDPEQKEMNAESRKGVAGNSYPTHRWDNPL